MGGSVSSISTCSRTPELQPPRFHYRKSRFLHANTRTVHVCPRGRFVFLLPPSQSEGKLLRIISLSPLRFLSFFSFCLRVLWSGGRDLGEPESVWRLSGCRGALRKLSGQNQRPWLLFEADCRCIIGSLSLGGRGNTHTAPHYRAEPHPWGLDPAPNPVFVLGDCICDSPLNGILSTQVFCGACKPFGTTHLLFISLANILSALASHDPLSCEAPPPLPKRGYYFSFSTYLLFTFCLVRSPT